MAEAKAAEADGAAAAAGAIGGAFLQPRRDGSSSPLVAPEAGVGAIMPRAVGGDFHDDGARGSDEVETRGAAVPSATPHVTVPASAQQASVAELDGDDDASLARSAQAPDTAEHTPPAMVNAVDVYLSLPPWCINMAWTMRRMAFGPGVDGVELPTVIRRIPSAVRANKHAWAERGSQLLGRDDFVCNPAAARVSGGVAAPVTASMLDARSASNVRRSKTPGPCTSGFETALRMVVAAANVFVAASILAAVVTHAASDSAEDTALVMLGLNMFFFQCMVVFFVVGGMQRKPRELAEAETFLSRLWVTESRAPKLRSRLRLVAFFALTLIGAGFPFLLPFFGENPGSSDFLLGVDRFNRALLYRPIFGENGVLPHYAGAGLLCVSLGSQVWLGSVFCELLSALAALVAHVESFVAASVPASGPAKHYAGIRHRFVIGVERPVRALNDHYGVWYAGGFLAPLTMTVCVTLSTIRYNDLGFVLTFITGMWSVTCLIALASFGRVMAGINTSAEELLFALARAVCHERVELSTGADAADPSAYESGNVSADDNEGDIAATGAGMRSQAEIAKLKRLAHGFDSETVHAIAHIAAAVPHIGVQMVPGTLVVATFPLIARVFSTLASVWVFLLLNFQAWSAVTG